MAKLPGEEPLGIEGGDSIVNNDSVEHNTLWDQMTAREGREAAHRAGMKTGDWQAERQLQQALQESRCEAGGDGAAGVGKEAHEEKSFIDVGSHALATEAVEGEDSSPEQQKASAGGAEGGNSNSHHVQPTGRRRTPGGCDTHGGSKKERRKEFSNCVLPGIVDEQRVSALAEEQDEEEELEDDMECADDVKMVVSQDLTFGIVAVNEQGAIVGSDRPLAADGHSVAAITGGAVADSKRSGGARYRSEEGGWEESKMEIVGHRESEKVSAAVKAEDAVMKSGSVRKRCAVSSNTTIGGREDACNGGAQKRDTADMEDGGREAKSTEAEEEESEEENISEPLPADIMLTLDDDSLHRTMSFLQPEDLIECRVVNSRWEFPMRDAVFELLCRRTYLAQSAKKKLKVARWRSWQRMFKLRPRLRTTGLYSLKTTYYKKPVRDMSTSWVPGQILEVTYYRYFRFFDDGRVAYGLTHETPKEFIRMLQENGPKVFYGTYTISKWEVNVEMPMPWSLVNFTLHLAHGERGHFTYLGMEKHSSIPRSDPRSGRCHHSVKSSDVFTFQRVGQF